MATFKGDWIRWFSYVCNYTIQNVEDFYKCVNTKMYRKDEIIFKAAEFSFATAQMSDVSLQWESFIDSLAHGTCQRLKNNGNMADGTYLKIFLNSSILYRIYIHDPNFHVTSMNPSGTPKLDLALNFEGQNLPAAFQYIYAEKHQFLNRDSEQCHDYEKDGSTFTACIAEHVSNKTRCKVSLLFCHVSRHKSQHTI